MSKSNGGTDRIGNLTLSCRECNQRKGNSDIRVFLSGKQDILLRILSQAKRPLKDAASVNATRNRVRAILESTGLPVSVSTGGRTKYNRECQGYPKKHWIDAACVGEGGGHVSLVAVQSLYVSATGRGSRQRCLMDRYGFPRTGPKASRSVYGFKTGDIVKTRVTVGKKKGNYLGKVAVRSSGYFNIAMPSGTIQGISSGSCSVILRADGYSYTTKERMARTNAYSVRQFIPAGTFDMFQAGYPC